MISGFRGKWAKVAVGFIVGTIALVFAIEGVFMSQSGGMGGFGGGGTAGSVNGEAISLSEFNRAYEQKINQMKSLFGDKVSDEQLKMFGVARNAFQEIAQRKLLAQDADRQGLQPTDEQLRQRIMELPYFQKDGKFDPLAYRQILEANRMSPTQFEKMIREELLVQEWLRSVSTQVEVSEAEARDEYLASKTQRNVKFVALPAAAAKKGDLAPAELAAKIAPMLRADKGSDAAVNALLKPYAVEVKSTELVSRGMGFLPGLGEQAEIHREVFMKPSPIQGRAKVYNTGSQIIVAVVTEAKDADPSLFDKEKKQYLSQTRSKKERQLVDAAVKKLTEKAKIQMNEEIVGSGPDLAGLEG